MCQCSREGESAWMETHVSELISWPSPRLATLSTHPLQKVPQRPQQISFHGARISSSFKVRTICTHFQVCKRRGRGKVNPGCDICPGRVLFRRIARCAEHQRSSSMKPSLSLSQSSHMTLSACKQRTTSSALFITRAIHVQNVSRLPPYDAVSSILHHGH
jgi:hypothetical protein